MLPFPRVPTSPFDKLKTRCKNALMLSLSKHEADGLRAPSSFDGLRTRKRSTTPSC